MNGTNVDYIGTVVVQFYFYAIAGLFQMITNIATETNESVKIELVIMIGSVGRLLIKIFYCHNLCDIKIFKR